MKKSMLLAGAALLLNASRKYVCRTVELIVENVQTPFTRAYAKNERVRIPIGHGEGNYFIDDEGLKRLDGEGRVVFRYVENPNGARHEIAGIINDGGNVLGMMPHPERAAESVLGGADGRRVFESLLAA